MTDFATLAVEARLAATREAYGAEALEIMAARSDAPVFATTLREARLSGARLGELYDLLRELEPLEQEVRALIARARRTAA